MSTVRAKMICQEVAHYPHTVKVRLGAVYSSDPNHENKAFSDATPSGSVEIMIQKNKPAAAMFEPGAEYYVDFTKA